MYIPNQRTIFRDLVRKRDKVPKLLHKNTLMFYTGVSDRALVATPNGVFYQMSPDVAEAISMFPYKWKLKLVVFSQDSTHRWIDSWEFLPNAPMLQHHLSAVALQYCIPLIKKDLDINSVYAVGWIASLREVDDEELYVQATQAGIWNFTEPMINSSDGQEFFNR